MWLRSLLVWFIILISLSNKVAANPLSEVESLLLAQRIQPDQVTLKRAKKIIFLQIKRDPSEARAWTLLAWARMTEHRFWDALKMAEIADSLVSDEPHTLALMSDALMELGHYDEAVDRVQRLIDIKPGVSAWIRIARLRFLHNDLEGAIQLMTKAARTGRQRGEESAWIWLELAKLYFYADQATRAGQAIDMADQAFPGLPTSFRLKARLLLRLGDAKGALALYRQALAIRPNAEDALAAWRIARQRGNNGLARHLSALMDGMARLDGYRLSRRALAEFFAESGRLRRAEELAREEFALRPDIYSHAVLARVLACTGDRSEAIYHAQAALTLNTPDSRLQTSMHAILVETPLTMANGASP